MPLILLVFAQAHIFGKMREELTDERIIDIVKKNRLDWVEKRVIRFKNLLNQLHVVLSNFLLFADDGGVHVLDLLVLLGKLDLPLNGYHPLNQVVLALGAQNILSVFVYDLETELLFREVLQDVGLSIIQHNQIEILILYQQMREKVVLCFSFL